MYAIDAILFRSLSAIMKKVCVIFQPDSISCFEEKVEQMDKRTDKRSKIIYRRCQKFYMLKLQVDSRKQMIHS